MEQVLKRRPGPPKGITNNLHGRPKGIKNKKTLLLDQFAQHIAEGGMARFIQEMNKLQGKSYVDTYLQVYEYVKPKLARTEHTGRDGRELELKQIFIIGGIEVTL